VTARETAGQEPAAGELAVCEPDMFGGLKGTTGFLSNVIDASKYNRSILHQLLTKDALMALHINPFHDHREFLDVLFLHDQGDLPLSEMPFSPIQALQA